MPHCRQERSTYGYHKYTGLDVHGYPDKYVNYPRMFPDVCEQSPISLASVLEDIARLPRFGRSRPVGGAAVAFVHQINAPTFFIENVAQSPREGRTTIRSRTRRMDRDPRDVWTIPESKNLF